MDHNLLWSVFTNIKFIAISLHGYQEEIMSDQPAIFQEMTDNVSKENNGW